MRPFLEYRVGVGAHELTLAIYAATKSFPREELFGLTSQMRRASSSIAMNIAEGSVHGEREFRRYLRVALGSATELEYQLLLARDLGCLSAESFAQLKKDVGSVKRMLQTFMRKLAPDDTEERPTANGQKPTARASASEVDE
jgi:four helix bundle protein